MLLNIDVGNVEPNVTEVSRGFADLGEDDSGFVGVALVREHTSDAVGRPNVLGIVSQDLKKIKTLLERVSPYTEVPF